MKNSILAILVIHTLSLMQNVMLKYNVPAILAICLLVGCNNKKNETFTPEVTLSQNSFEFSPEGGKSSISVTTNTPLEIEGDKAGWYSLSSNESTEKNIQIFTVSAEPNNNAEPRQAKLTLLGRDYARDIYINQEGKSVIYKPEEAMALAKKLGMGWNLGNQLDAHANEMANETIWGNQAATQTTFDKLAEAGFASVRIPITWLGKVAPAPDYTIDSKWLNRVAEVVAYAENAGLNVIINIHHDGGDSKHWLNIKDAALDPQVNRAVKAQLAAMWTQIAEKFKDKGDFLIFESLNEVHDGKWGYGANLNDGGKQYATLNGWNQVFVDAVRATGANNSNRYLGIPGYVTNSKLTIDHMVLPVDPAENRLMVSVHYYDPHKFTLEDEFKEWGHSASADKKADYGDEDFLKDIFGKLKTKYIDKGIPVYIGETGCVHRDTERAEDFRKYYLEYICKAAREYGMAPFYWDNGAPGTGRECSGIINHATGEYINNGGDIAAIMVNAITNDDPAYTLESVYNKAP